MRVCVCCVCCVCCMCVLRVCVLRVCVCDLTQVVVGILLSGDEQAAVRRGDGGGQTDVLLRRAGHVPHHRQEAHGVGVTRGTEATHQEPAAERQTGHRGETTTV